MKSAEIKQLFGKFESAAAEVEGIECWSAREMQALLGYSKWENFEKVIQNVRDECNNAEVCIFKNHLALSFIACFSVG